MVTVITGGRSYVLTVADAKWLDALRESLPITEVLHGDATGADAGAKKWAGVRGVPCRVGGIEEADIAIAFGDAGPAVTRAEARGLIVLVRPRA